MNIQNILLAATLSIFAIASSSLRAEFVTLDALDGSLSISGELLDATPEYYIISSNIGNLTIATDAVMCSGEACPSLLPEYSEFTVSGSRSLSLGLMPILLDGFAASLDLDIIQETDEDGSPRMVFQSLDGTDVAKISFQMRGSSAGLRDLMADKASLALTTRVARPSEVSAFSSAGLGNIRAPGKESVLALDGLVVVTSKANRVRIIALGDLAAIFAGEITDWAELGGVSSPINLYARPDNSGTGALFSQLVLRPNRARLSPDAVALESDAAVATAVASDPNGIGFTSFANSGNAEPVSLLGVCNIQSPATPFTIQVEEYPFARRLYLYQSPHEAPALVQMFVDYLETPEAQKLIELTGYVGQGSTEIPVNDQGLRFLSAALPTDAEMTLVQLQAMMLDLSTAQRLTLTYRFEQGTTRLDSRGLADIERLVQQMSSNALNGKQLILLGFTDSVGKMELNQSLSRSRAEQVRTAILEAGAGRILPAQVEVRGYGELSPLGCNETIDGRRINRRVEVWVR